jgi:hypothetical protein
MNTAGRRFRHAVDGMSLLSAHADFDNARIIFYKLSNGLSPKAPQPSKFADPIMCSATIRSRGRVASIKNVTELLIVVGGQLQGFSDILSRQLVRLDVVW